MAQSAGFDMALALSRFGLGAGSDGIPAGDPREILRSEIGGGGLALQGPGLRATPDLLGALFDYQAERKAMQQAPAPPSSASSSSTMSSAVQSPAPATSPQMMQDMQGAMKPDMASPPASPLVHPAKPPNPDVTLIRDTSFAEIDARYNGSVKQAAIGFNERMVMFWMNHFAISTKKSELCAISAGAYEREAIRPHAFGRFYDLVLAVESHPCMLEYLDAQQSVGPDSPAVGRSRRGLNENLAREIMELHTLGVGSGYSQTDVTSFAKVITGWTFARQAAPNAPPPGSFWFNDRAHEPGPQTVLGKTYAQKGVDQGQAVLRDLCRHPATAHHIATKLAIHFVSDTPPPALVGRLAQTFQDSDGDLAAVAHALVESKEAWTPALMKTRSPNEYLCALIRATGVQMRPGIITGALTNMGQALWQPSGPNGYPDTVAAWASPEGVAARMEQVSAFVHHLDPTLDPRAFAESHLGGLLTDATRDAIARAETHPQGLSLVFLSPEFMRR